MGDAGYRVQEEGLIRSDIAGYLKRHEEKDLLRFLTCGSVDDGKSTLIGRLLYWAAGVAAFVGAWQVFRTRED